VRQISYVPKGLLSLALHAHLPFVRHPEHDEFLEEDWLYEAITEVYLPLLGALTRLRDAGARPRLSMSISPTLCEMLSDPLLRFRYARHLDNLRSLARKEAERTATQAPHFRPAARQYDERLREAARLWDEVYSRDLVRAFADLQTAGVVEINTCAATHGFLPLVSTTEARRAQIQVAVANYRKHFGRRPRGIWLPECAYAEGVETLLAEVGLEYFFADAHALLYGEPRPRFGVHAPARLPNGVAVFARDVETGEQVWSARGGYPGDPFYREFYRDIGWDAPLDHVRPHLHADGRRRALGLKYHRVTGRDVPLSDKRHYEPHVAAERAREHARHFVASRVEQVARLREAFGNSLTPLVVSPYDAELFGHWWYEGVDFLEHVFRHLDARRAEIAPASPGDYLDSAPQLQTVRLSQSSWGEGGYNKVWLSEQNAWLYPRQHACEARMTALADRFAPVAARDSQDDELTVRALKQAARELLLAQSSDWAFQIYQGTTATYAASRFNAHVERFHRLAASIERGAVERDFLEETEGRDNLFPEINFRVFCSRLG
jgi:1,4-alpha-glucan branching enzyme